MQKLNITFTATLTKVEHKGGWTYLIWRESAKFFKTKSLVKVRGTMDGHKFESSFMAMGGGVHMLPVKAALRVLMKKEAGKRVTVHLTARID